MKFKHLSIILSTVICLSPTLYAANGKANSDTIYIQEEADDTDIYAIPLDNDEAEEKAQMQRLRSLECQPKKK